jgi:hypothetical protein
VESAATFMNSSLPKRNFVIAHITAPTMGTVISASSLTGRTLWSVRTSTIPILLSLALHGGRFWIVDFRDCVINRAQVSALGERREIKEGSPYVR